MYKIGTESLMAFALIKSAKEGRNFVSFDNLNKYAVNLQGKFNECGIDAMVINSSYINVIKEWNNYFEFMSNIYAVKLSKGMTVNQLEERFMLFLPSEIEEILEYVNVNN